MGERMGETVRETLSEGAGRWRITRIDVAAETAKNYGSHLLRITAALGERDPVTITTADIQVMVAACAGEMKPASVSRYIATLRQVLDFAGLDPNPARAVRLPRITSEPAEPPALAEFRAMLEFVPARWVLALRILDATAMRVGELAELELRDVDFAGDRFRIRVGKTRSARRWVQVPPVGLAPMRGA